MPHRAHVLRDRAAAAGPDADPRRLGGRSGRGAWPSCCRCSARTSRASSGPWTGSRSPSGSSIRRCTSSCQHTTTLLKRGHRAGDPARAEVGRTRRTRRTTLARQADDAGRGGAAAREEPDARAPRASGSASTCPGWCGCRCARSSRPRATCAEEGVEVFPKIMIPLVTHGNELRFEQRGAGGGGEEGDERAGDARSRYQFGTMIEIPRAALTADEIAVPGAVLLLRDQRPDADHLRHLAGRRRDQLPLRVPAPGHPPREPVRPPWTRAGWDS